MNLGRGMKDLCGGGGGGGGKGNQEKRFTDADRIREPLFFVYYTVLVWLLIREAVLLSPTMAPLRRVPMGYQVED
jgi:hypothetical protein